MYDQTLMQYYPDDPKVVYRDFKGDEIYEGDEYVEYEGDLILVTDVEQYFLDYLATPVKVAEYFDEYFTD